MKTNNLENRIRQHLNKESARFNSCDFVLPYDLSKLAEFMNCDQKTLENALSRLKDKNVLDYSGKHFWIKVPVE